MRLLFGPSHAVVLPGNDAALKHKSSPKMNKQKQQQQPVLATPAVSNKMLVLFVLIVITCAMGLISVATIMQRHDLRLLADDSAISQGGGGLRGQELQAYAAHNEPTLSLKTKSPTPGDGAGETRTPVDLPGGKLPVDERWRELGNLSDYECVKWRAAAGCTPDGGVDEHNDRTCDAVVHDGESGFCEIRHKHTGVIKRVMKMHCSSLRPDVTFRCQDFQEILMFGHIATDYVHDPSFSFNQCQEEFINDQTIAGLPATSYTAATQVSLQRGIVFIVYEKLFESVFASIRSLRDMGCTLPMELWYKSSETNISHPILQTLARDYGAFLREIKDPRATKFYTKIYAVFYSGFDQVLLLDSDNFAVKDPTYLFSTPEFVDTGAIFWPDFWRAKKTIFNIQPTSFVWDVFDLDVIDMFEQESGQVLIDRRRHVKALNVLMYYAFHPQLFEQMRLVWGDKDLFRFAWLKSKSPFHMIEMPPGAAGRKLPDKNIFCGVTMVQHDPQNEIIFFHRNMEKLSSENQRIVWEHVQQFRLGEVPIDDYDVRGANGGRYYPQFKRCYGKDIYYEKAFTVTAISDLPFANFEQSLVDYVGEAATLSAQYRAQFVKQTNQPEKQEGANAQEVRDNGQMVRAPEYRVKNNQQQQQT